MSYPTRGRKKSDFIAQSSIAGSDTLDFVSGGSNRKITYADFIASLGVTGSLAQQGAVTGTPILNTSGSVHGIRNIEDGPGVKASVSPEGGVTLEHNFQLDQVGVALSSTLAVESPVLRSLVAGGGVSISGSGDEILISTSSAKTVIVSQESDFPAAVAGVIALESSTHYLLVDDVSTASRFSIGSNAVVSAADEVIIGLTYTGTGVMFTANAASFTLKDVSLTCATGTFIDINGTGVEIAQVSECNISCDTLGSADDVAGFRMANNQISVTTNGLLFGGSIGVALISGAIATVSAGTLFDLGAATFNGLTIVFCFATLNGASSFLDGAASSANINTGGLGSLSQSRFYGTGAPMQTITVEDALWQFLANDDIADTRPDALISMQGNAVETVIAVAGTPVLVAGVWVMESESQFTTTVDGRMTYDGGKDAKVPITFSCSVEPVSGTNIGLSLYVSVNGSVVTNSQRRGAATAGSAHSITAMWQISFSTGDYVEIYAANDDTTSNIICSSGIGRVN